MNFLFHIINPFKYSQVSKVTQSFPFTEDTCGWMVSHVQRLCTPLVYATARIAMGAISCSRYTKAVFKVNRDRVAGSSKTSVKPSHTVNDGNRAAGG